MSAEDFADLARRHGVNAHPVRPPFRALPELLDAFTLTVGGVGVHVGFRVAADTMGGRAEVLMFSPLVVSIPDSAVARTVHVETPGGILTVATFEPLSPDLRAPGWLQAGLLLRIDATGAVDEGSWGLLFESMLRFADSIAEQARFHAPRLQAQFGGRSLIAVIEAAATENLSPFPSPTVAGLVAAPGTAPRSVLVPGDVAPKELGERGKLRLLRYRSTLLWVPYSVLLVLAVLNSFPGADSTGSGEVRVDYVDGAVVATEQMSRNYFVPVLFFLWVGTGLVVAKYRTKSHEVGAASLGENFWLYLAWPGRLVVVATMNLLILMLPGLGIALGVAAGLALLLVLEAIPLPTSRWGNQHGGGWLYSKPDSLLYLSAAAMVVLVVGFAVFSEVYNLLSPVWGPPFALFDTFGMDRPSWPVSFGIGLVVAGAPLANEVALVRKRAAA